jgi:hypothetical protein
MQQASEPSRRPRWELPLAAIAFALAHTQTPLYYSNQNQYFLQGLADAGRGHLAADWLANTRDPTPVFSALVSATYSVAGEWPFHVYYFLLLAIYFVSLVRLCDVLPRRPESPTARLIFYALLIAVHAAALRAGSARLLGTDYPWYLQCGVAGQYVLGPGLQPSAFGVLLVTAVALLAHGRYLWAAACWCAAATLHSTYLLPAAFLTLGSLAVLLRERRVRLALTVGLASLLAVLPVVVYNLRQFSPTSPEAFAEAQSLLVELRIPHHAVVGKWLDGIAWGQIAWVALGIFLTRGTRLFPVLAVCASLAVALTLAQLATGSDFLALLFPWRVSAVLVPVATAVILANVASRLAVRIEGRTARRAGAGVIAGLAAAGVAMMALRVGYRMDPGELPALEHVRANAEPGDVYLVPVTVPRVGSGPKGSVSTSFTPPPRAGRSGHLIPVDLQRVRLFTGAPIYVDFKAIPYQDVEVLEWHRRLRRAEAWFSRKAWGPGVRDDLRAEGVTHVLVPADRVPEADFLELKYADDSYRLYEVATADRQPHE